MNIPPELEEAELDHVGIAVDDLETARVFYEAIGCRVSGADEVASEAVKVLFLGEGSGRIELLEATSEASAIARHIAKRGPGIHHVCFRVADIKASMERLREAGYRLLDEQPRAGAHGCLVCFVHPKSAGGVLIELSQAGT